MFSNVYPGEILMTGVPGSHYHIWFCEECQKWHSEFLRPEPVQGVIMMQNTGMFNTDTLAEMMEEIAGLTIAALAQEMSTETAEVLEEMWGSKFEKLVRLYDAICLTFDMGGNDDH